MTNFLLFLIFLELAGVIILSSSILDELRRSRTDFTKEDASVKASTEEVKKAKGRLPKTGE